MKNSYLHGYVIGYLRKQSAEATHADPNAQPAPEQPAGAMMDIAKAKKRAARAQKLALGANADVAVAEAQEKMKKIDEKAEKEAQKAAEAAAAQQAAAQAAAQQQAAVQPPPAGLPGRIGQVQAAPVAQAAPPMIKAAADRRIAAIRMLAGLQKESTEPVGAELDAMMPKAKSAAEIEAARKQADQARRANEANKAAVKEQNLKKSIKSFDADIKRHEQGAAAYQQ